MLWHDGSEQEVKILAADCQYFHLLLVVNNIDIQQHQYSKQQEQ